MFPISIQKYFYFSDKKKSQIKDHASKNNYDLA